MGQDCRQCQRGQHADCGNKQAAVGGGVQTSSLSTLSTGVSDAWCTQDTLPLVMLGEHPLCA